MLLCFFTVVINVLSTLIRTGKLLLHNFSECSKDINLGLAVQLRYNF